MMTEFMFFVNYSFDEDNDSLMVMLKYKKISGRG